jgi:uncharacterized protein (DUF1499 family)
MINASDLNFGNSKIEPCPNSPNCVSTLAVNKRKKMQPLEFTGTPNATVEKLTEMMKIYSNATFISREGNYLHYTFKTKIGKFIDDIEFEIDEEAKVIHFKSASREGYGDFGKNRRRMKMITKEWKRINKL